MTTMRQMGVMSPTKGLAARGNGAAEHHAGLLRAQPSGAAHQGDAEHAGSDLNTSARDAGQCTDGEAAQAVHSGESVPGAASTPANGRPQARNGTPCRQDAGTSESPGGGPTGVGQPAAAGPTGDQRRGPATGAQADGCRAPECHAGACSGRAQQDQTSLPASPMRIALWNDGALQDIDAAIDAAMGVREQGA